MFIGENPNGVLANIGPSQRMKKPQPRCGWAGYPFSVLLRADLARFLVVSPIRLISSWVVLHSVAGLSVALVQKHHLHSGCFLLSDVFQKPGNLRAGSLG
jgi:hypothetical protein